MACLLMLLGPAHALAAAGPGSLIDLHSSFWVNLHQVLFHEALLSTGKPDYRLQDGVPLAAGASAKLSEADQAVWEQAVRFYATHFQGRRELFDDELVDINEALAAQPDDGARPPAGLPTEVAAVLNAAAPVYRRCWWGAHDRSNKDWIASQAPRLRELGPAMAKALTAALRHPWPAKPIRVDIVFRVAEVGHAYTVDTHTTLASSEEALAGLSGFETLFHEASHALADTMQDALGKECSAQHKDCADLWHAVLFFTGGVELRRVLPPQDREGFVPYAEHYGLYERGTWPHYRPVLESHWQAYLDGREGFAAAVHGMAADLR